MIHAGALARRGDTNRAMRQAWSAITAMAQAGYFSSIADEYILLAPLIDGLVIRAHDPPDTRSAATIAAIDELSRLISRLFALVTIELEDAAGIAANCQGRRAEERLREGAEKLDALLSEAGTILAGASAVLAEDR